MTRSGALGLRQILLPICFALSVLVAWEALVRAYDIHALILVPPSRVVASLPSSYALLLRHAVPTLRETVAGFLISAVLGTGLAVLIAWDGPLRAALYPNVVFFQLIPKIAVAPLFMVWFGVGPESRLAMSIFISFFAIAVSMIAGLRSADRYALRLCQSLTATPWQIFVHVRFPFALPHLFSGMKIAMTLSLIGVVVGEFITGQVGLGYIVLFASYAGETALMLASIIYLCVLGLGLYGAVVLAERTVMRRYGQPV